jgi:uncharacterized protein (TIGR00730 family)
VTTGDAALDALIRELANAAGGEKPRELIEEMLTTAIKMAKDQTTVADLKMLNRALKELRYASRVFAPYRAHRKVSVFGSARTPEEAPDAQMAHEFAKEMVRRSWMVITGGGDGIMGAAQKGAGAANSFGLNIKLPFEQSANETIVNDTKLMNFNYFFTRKLNFVKESSAIALFPGGFGTMDEGFEALTLMQTGKARIFPVVFVDKPGGKYWEELLRFLHDHLLGNRLVSPDDFHLIHHCDSVKCAADHIEQFYSNYHSYRWLGPRMIVRMQRPLSQERVEQMDTEFADVLASGKFEQSGALPVENTESDIAHLPRLVFQPHKRNFGRLRLVLNAVNVE